LSELEKAIEELKIAFGLLSQEDKIAKLDFEVIQLLISAYNDEDNKAYLMSLSDKILEITRMI
jgi:hypothetical protein